MVYGDKMYLFGGSSMSGENEKFFSLDLNTIKWEVVTTRKGETPASRDEHTAVLYEKD